jgi:hypothetical protein
MQHFGEGRKSGYPKTLAYCEQHCKDCRMHSSRQQRDEDEFELQRQQLRAVRDFRVRLVGVGAGIAVLIVVAWACTAAAGGAPTALTLQVVLTAWTLGVVLLGACWVVPAIDAVARFCQTPRPAKCEPIARPSFWPVVDLPVDTPPPRVIPFVC